ncbi:MAG: sigma-70 family RNA polymerase sigma factor [Oscillospiraceae bacterium]|nr:sigma-70 family RNA polymerase sigma factor [Oscillospiraceae bacterium]
MDEKNALRALKKKDEAALAWFIDRYAAYVNTIVYNIIGRIMTASDVEEVASDVFLVFWSNADKVKPDKIKAYLGGVARNKAKDKTRELGQDLPLEDDVIGISSVGPEHTFELREQAEMLEKAIRSMQHPDREIFLRHYYYCHPVAQIAEEMKINASTVKTRLRRGRQKLKEILSEGGFDDEIKNLRYDGQYTG